MVAIVAQMRYTCQTLFEKVRRNTEMTKILIDEAVVRFVMDAIDGFFAAPDDEADQEAQEELLTARSKLRQALADAALDKMAENARELGLDYE